MATIDPELFRIGRKLMAEGGGALRAKCDEVRRLAKKGDSDDRFQAEFACMSAWEARGKSGHEEAVECGRRLLAHRPEDAYDASCAAATFIRLRRDLDIGLGLIEIGLDVSKQDTDLCYRGWAASDLMANRLALLVAENSDSEQVLEALEEFSTLATSWHVEYDVVLDALDKVAARSGVLPWAAMGILERMWCRVSWRDRGQSQKSDLLSRIEQLITVTEECPTQLPERD